MEAFVVNRACELSAIGFGIYDALHLAFAEQTAADIFLTTDDRLLKLASKCSSLIKVKVDNPLGWLREVIQNEYRDHDS
jgi:predicted nucleic acid-binding protein